MVLFLFLPFCCVVCVSIRFGFIFIFISFLFFGCFFCNRLKVKVTFNIISVEFKNKQFIIINLLGLFALRI